MKQDESAAQEGFAAGEDVLEGALEVAGVPGVGDVASAAGIGHQQVDLALRVGGDYVPEPAQVTGVHADEAVEAVIVLGDDRTCPLQRVEPYSVLAEAAPGGRVDGVAVLLVRDGGGLDIE